MPLTLDDLAGTNGLGFLIGDTSSGSQTDRYRRINDAYLTKGCGRYFWCKREHDYTTTSTPALATAGNRKLYTPTASGSDFDRPYRLHYRQAGRVVDLEILEDDEWLIYSATRTADAGYPEVCRLAQDSTGIHLELNRPLSQGFIDSIGTVTLEHFINPARLTSGTQQPIVPDRLRPHLVTIAAYTYAMAQGDVTLQAAITRKLGQSLTTAYEEACAAFRRHDLTRTGRSRVLRARDTYAPSAWGGGGEDYGMRS